jgi:MFS family permease
MTSEPVTRIARGLALLVAGAYFMEILDATMIAPAAPHIAADLRVPAVAVNVAITAYVLTLAVLIPVTGWLTDRFGARRVFVAARSPCSPARRRPARRPTACRCWRRPE